MEKSSDVADYETDDADADGNGDDDSGDGDFDTTNHAHSSAASINSHAEDQYIVTQNENTDILETSGVEDADGIVKNVPDKKFKQIKALNAITKWWRGYVDDKMKKRKKVELAEELRMRYKLKYHFMSPYQKYRFGRKPWKLAIQILKILIVTTQVVLFGTDRFAAVAFIRNIEKSFKNLFIENYDGTSTFSYYSRNDLVSAIKFAHSQYQNISNIAIGKFWHSKFQNDSNYPIWLCETRSNNAKENYKIMSMNYDSDKKSECQILNRKTDLGRILDTKHYFDSIDTFQIQFEIRVIYLNAMKLHHTPECLLMENTIAIDNSKHDGRLRVAFRMVQNILRDCVKGYKVSSDATAVKYVFIVFDGLVIVVCVCSLILCIRSVVKSIMLAKAAQRYFKVYKNEDLTKWDLFELVNKWFALIVLSDLLSIVGSIYKIYVDGREIKYYNICSIFLGLGVILVWVGLLRFFTYVKTYNILLITLRSAAPNLFRFMFCAMFIFFGFTFCGWLVLGPYHIKFATFLRTAECLFSILNGDEVFPTFQLMNKSDITIWVFSKIYLYIFVSLFIYVVLSTFISIIGDTYERLKDWGHMPLTKIEMFMAGNKVINREVEEANINCQRCIRENSVFKSRATNRFISGSPEESGRHGSVSSDNMSIVSASLE